MKVRGVIFDMDGTLLDTMERIALVMNTVLERRSLPVHEMVGYRRFVGDGIRMLVEKALPEGRRDEATVAQVIAEVKALYDGERLKGTPAYSGIPELLQELDRRRIPKAILSNKEEKFTRAHAEVDLAHFTFDPIVGARPDLPLKPAPDGALLIAGRWGIPPAGILFVGDMPADVLTARAAGMPCAAALWGFSDKEDLVAAGATVFIEHPLDVVRLL
ncbi:MAG TPA: HAD family hydrolase [bacterium]|nr:HAD family hydrolase [bacterium]